MRNHVIIFINGARHTIRGSVYFRCDIAPFLRRYLDSEK